MRAEFAISVIALLVSVLCALYARRAAVHAHQANRISLHDRKLEVLDSFKRFHAALGAMGWDFDASDLYPLLAAPDKAKLYFQRPIVTELRQCACD